MNNEQLINELVKRNKSVTRIHSPKTSLLHWMIVSGVWIIICMLIIGVRTDFNLEFGLYFFILLFLAVTSAYGCLNLSIPDNHSRTIYWGPFTVFGLWILLLLISMLTPDGVNSEDGLLCLRDIVIFSLVPAAFLFSRVKKGSVLQTTITGILCALASAGLGALATQFTCQDSYGIHQLQWHVPTVVGLMSFGIIIRGKFRQ